MSVEEKKIYNTDADTTVGPAHGQAAAGYGQQQADEDYDYYDPMAESRMTRLGLNWESFKRAPGSTR
jgi:hypothetical protein